MIAATITGVVGTQRVRGWSSHDPITLDTLGSPRLREFCLRSRVVVVVPIKNTSLSFHLPLYMHMQTTPLN